MPKDINAVSILGNAFRFELRYSDKGKAVLDLGIAGEETVVTREGKTIQVPFYMNTSVIGKAGEELAAELAEDGTTIVHVAAELEHRKWVKDGVENQRLFIRADSAQIVLAAPDLGFSKDAGGNSRYKGGHARATISARVVGDNQELKTTPGSAFFMNMRLNVRGKPINVDGEWQNPANWLKMTLWDTQAQTANDLGITKGNEVFAEGRLQMGRDWKDKEGNTRRGEVELVPTSLVWLKGGGSSGAPKAAVAPPKWDSGAADAFDSNEDDDSPF